MVIRYKGFYIDTEGNTVKVTLGVDVPSASHLDPDFKIISNINYYMPRWINELDCCIDITVCDNYRNKFHDYRFHNGHYAKFVVDGYFWLDYRNQVTAFKDLGAFPRHLIVDPTIDGDDMKATFALAKKLWHID